jgi:hypothetical protein
MLVNVEEAACRICLPLHRTKQTLPSQDILVDLAFQDDGEGLGNQLRE